jgi:hypothetical protein
MEWLWTSWKLGFGKQLPSVFLSSKAYYKLQNSSNALPMPRENATSAQILANCKFFHRELGTRADCPLRSRCRIQKGNAMSSTRLTASREAVVPDLMIDNFALTIL